MMDTNEQYEAMDTEKLFDTLQQGVMKALDDIQTQVALLNELKNRGVDVVIQSLNVEKQYRLLDVPLAILEGVGRDMSDVKASACKNCKRWRGSGHPTMSRNLTDPQAEMKAAAAVPKTTATTARAGN